MTIPAEFHQTCARIAGTLNYLIPATTDRSAVHCLPGYLTEGEHTGKRVLATFLQFRGDAGENLEFAIAPSFEDTDTWEHIAHVTVGAFCMEWHHHQKQQEVLRASHP